MSDKPTSAPTAPGAASRPRDPRLDFFRGLAMFIILFAHTPGNSWTLWIPARFGFSDATEIFVFCSGMASAIAFGKIFESRGWLLGTARVAFRVWQVYWAQIGVVLVTAGMLLLIDRQGWGLEGKVYIETLPLKPLIDDTAAALLGLFTLTWIPNLFDILPMYLVILAMIPLVMALHRFAGFPAVAVALLALWLATQMQWTDLPGRPWNPDIRWFFNPFGWQLVFFTGFAFGMGWLGAPPRDRRLVYLAAAFVLLTIPFAWHKIHGAIFLPDAWLLHDWIYYARQGINFLWWKSDQGFFRWLHFLALAYLAWMAVGVAGERLRSGFRPPEPLGRAWLVLAAVVLVLTFPYTYVETIQTVLPALHRGIVHMFGTWAPETLGFSLFIQDGRIGLAHLAHLAAAVVLVWAAIGPRWRAWVVQDGFTAVVPIIRKVGTQSLAVFLMSIPLSRFNGWVLDMIGREPVTWALVNLGGCAVLIGVAYGVGWIKSQPWRGPRVAPSPPAPSASIREPAQPRPAE
ncbi:MAG: OpgC domain-containing protein [Pseudomonadota bacterium]